MQETWNQSQIGSQAFAFPVLRTGRGNRLISTHSPNPRFPYLTWVLRTTLPSRLRLLAFVTGSPVDVPPFRAADDHLVFVSASTNTSSSQSVSPPDSRFRPLGLHAPGMFELFVHACAAFGHVQIDTVLFDSIHGKINARRMGLWTDIRRLVANYAVTRVGGPDHEICTPWGKSQVEDRTVAFSSRYFPTAASDAA